MTGSIDHTLAMEPLRRHATVGSSHTGSAGLALQTDDPGPGNNADMSNVNNGANPQGLEFKVFYVKVMYV